MARNNDRWSALSMSDRADLIKLYVENGITNIGDIRKHYNSFDEGGTIEPLYYDDTYIEPAVVKAFKSQEDYNRFQGKKFGEHISNEISKAGSKLAPVLVGTAAAPWLISGAISGGIMVNSLLTNSPRLKKAIDIIGTLDGIRNVASENGIKKTINHIDNEEYGKATLSGIADIFDIAGGVGYLKDINLVNGLVDDINFSKKFFRDIKNPSTAEKIYNLSRPLLRAVGKPFRDIINPVLYRAMMLNNGDASGKGIINNLLGNSELAYPLIKVKNENGILNKAKAIFKNYNTSLYNAEHAQNLNDVYGTYLYQNLLWKNPSNLTLSSDPLAKRIFENARGLSRYSDLPIYTLGFDKPTSLGHGFSSKDNTLKPIIYDPKSGKINIRGTYYKNGTNFRPKKSPTESYFTSTNQDIGGHFIAISKRKDLKGNSFGWPSHFFDVAIKDTQHFTPTDYMKKWKQKNPLKAIPLAIMDIMGDDFNLFGRGVYEVYPSWNDMTPIISYRKNIPTLESSFKKNGGKLNRYTTGGPVKTFDVNNPISPTQYWEDFIAENSVPFSIAPEAAIDENELVRRQAWAESAGNDRAGSHKGAKGRYQIMPDTLSEYQKATGDVGDIYDPIYNRRVRDWEFNRYKNSDQVNRGEPTDSVKMGRRLAIYNYGYGNVRKALNKADSLGAGIDTSFEWLQYLPQETQDYVNFILRNKDTGAHRTNDAYKNRKK